MVSRRNRRQRPQRGGGSCGLPQRGGGSCGLPQRGGGWGYDGSTIMSAAGAPLDVRSVTNDCTVPVRAAPLQLGGGCGCNKQIGGSRRKKRKQRQTGGGGGSGGYMVDVGSNDLGKMAIYTPGVCPQRGGNAISAYTAGYSATDPVILDSGSRYMEFQKAGTRRNRRTRARKQTRRH